MPLHIRHEMAVEVKHVGILALVGTTFHSIFELEGPKQWTKVYFVLQSPPNAPLTSYISPEPFLFEADGILFHIWEQRKQWMNSVTDSNTSLLFFERTVEGRLREPNKFLHATADKLRKELQQVEDLSLSIDEMEDEREWESENYGSQEPMPNFKRPRHTD